MAIPSPVLSLDLLLETIDLLRARKARPNVRRISHQLERKYMVHPSEVVVALNYYTERGAIRSVDFKGSVSYRNPAKSRIGRPSYTAATLLDMSTSGSGSKKRAFDLAMDEAMGGAVIDERSSGDTTDLKDDSPILSSIGGSSCNMSDEDLESDEEVLNEKKKILKEEGKDRLQKGNAENDSQATTIENIEESQPEQLSEESQMPRESSTNHDRTPSRRRKRKVEVTSPVRESRRKRIQKEIFDPSEASQNGKSYVMKKIKLGSKSPSQLPQNSSLILDDEDACFVCKKEVRVHGVKCMHCDTYAHKACVGSNEKGKWDCGVCCKKCAQCEQTLLLSNDIDSLISCRQCHDTYHSKCVSQKKITASWLCHHCINSSHTPSSESTESSAECVSARSTPDRQVAKTKKKFDAAEKPTEKVSYDEEIIPDCSQWNPEQVYNYFLAFVSSQDAQVFREQHINGKCLLLLQRTDVISHFKLKLGPALKIYSHVKKLQDRKMDPTLTWA